MKRPNTGQPVTPQAARDAYNRQYGAEPIRDQDRFYDWFAQKVVERVAFSDDAPLRVLDVGCGGGYLLGAFRERLAGRRKVELVGIDIADVALEHARSTVPEARLVLSQGEHLPVASNGFGIVVCSGNLEHFVDPAAGARELARVCAPDGQVWLLLPNSFYSGDIWRVIRTGYGPNHHQIVDRFASVNEWRDFVEENGLLVDAIWPYNRFKWWKRLLPRNLAYHFLYQTRPRATEHRTSNVEHPTSK